MSFIREVEEESMNPLDLFVSSTDALRHAPIDHLIPPDSGWSARPGTCNKNELRELCRRGIPPCLRCAIWMVNVFGSDETANNNVNSNTTNTNDSPPYEHGTLGKVRILEHGWNLVQQSCFPDESDVDRAEVLDFGLGHDHLANVLTRDHGSDDNDGLLDERGVRTLILLMHGVRDSLGVEFCPLLPDLCCLLLSHMSESYAFATLRQMLHDDSPYFLTVSRVQHLALCKTFSDLMRRCFPQTHAVMDQIGALTPVGLDPILKRLFVPLLRRRHVLRIMDIYTGEGIHSLLRIGTTLCCLSHAHLGETVRERCDNAAVFWEGVRRFAHSKHFHFDAFLQHQAYGVQKSFRVLTRPIFPRADFVARMMAQNEVWAEANQANLPIHAETKTLGLVEAHNTTNTNTNIPMELAKDSSGRLYLAKWLPPVLQSTKLELIYSSNHHGRSVEMFYRCCASSKHTITLMEVLDRDEPTVIGMYATHRWRNCPEGYGDGGCFLFRLRPFAECFRYKTQDTMMNIVHSYDDDEEDTTTIDNSSIDVTTSSLNDTGQLMISGSDFISMGVGEDGSSGLRLNEDLTRGSTSNSLGSGKKELVGQGVQVFDVGLVEVYRFVREVDGRPVDGDVDPWRGKFD